jgi:hypothetical protein
VIYVALYLQERTFNTTGNIGWEDPEYRKCYQKILEGKWEEYDPFDATHRVDAVMDMYDCGGRLLCVLVN